MGRINEIAHMDASQMLSLLLDYSGATHHEEKLTKIWGFLSQMDDKREEMQQIRSGVQDKLQFISEKVSDFQKLQDLAGRKSSLEYIIKKEKGQDIQE